MRFTRTVVGLIALAALPVLGAAPPASASSTQYYSLVAYGACGRIAPVRELTEATGGYLNAKSGLITWTFSISNSTSRVHWQACGSAAPYGNYDVAAQRLSQGFAFSVTAPRITSCSAPGGRCNVGFGTASITATQSLANVGALTYYLNGQTIGSLFPAKVTVRASASVTSGAYGGSVTTATQAWAF